MNGFTVKSHARFSGANADRSVREPVYEEKRDKQKAEFGEGSVGRKQTHRRVIHERLKHGWAKARVQLAPKHRGGYVEARTYLALGEAVNELRDVVREMP